MSKVRGRHEIQLVTVATLARQWQVSRSSVVRILARYGVRPIFLGSARRYYQADADRVFNRLQQESRLQS